MVDRRGHWGGGCRDDSHVLFPFHHQKKIAALHTSRTSAKVFFREGGHMSRWTTACGSWLFTRSRTPLSNHHHVTGPPLIRPGHSERQKRGRKRGGGLGPLGFTWRLVASQTEKHMDTNYKSASITDSTPRSCTSQIQKFWRCSSNLELHSTSLYRGNPNCYIRIKKICNCNSLPKQQKVIHNMGAH